MQPFLLRAGMESKQGKLCNVTVPGKQHLQPQKSSTAAKAEALKDPPKDAGLGKADNAMPL